MLSSVLAGLPQLQLKNLTKTMHRLTSVHALLLETNGGGAGRHGGLPRRWQFRNFALVCACWRLAPT
jgi:hypothetical protein